MFKKETHSKVVRSPQQKELLEKSIEDFKKVMRPDEESDKLKLFKRQLTDAPQDVDTQFSLLKGT